MKFVTSDLAITRGCKSELCHPAVNGANMSCPLNLRKNGQAKNQGFATSNLKYYKLFC